MRKLEAAIAKRGLDALAALLDSVGWQSDYVEILHAGGVDLDETTSAETEDGMWCIRLL